MNTETRQATRVAVELGRAPKGRPLYSVYVKYDDGSECRIVHEVDKRTAQAEAKAYRAAHGL